MAYSVLISDFDNTLYDWFEMWHASFSSLLSEIERLSGIPQEILLPEIRGIHQRHRTSEYAFLIEEIPSLRSKFPDENLVAKFDEAIHQYRRARKATLHLYDGVLDTLLWLKRRGVPIILYTESLEYYTNYRIKKLELDGLVDVVYSPEDHEVPGHISEMQTRSDPLEVGKLRFTAHRGIPRNVIKPNPEVLFDILNDQKIDRDKCVYVGDSLMKDVAMAQKAGIADVYAAYGHVQTHPGYDLLRKVSHWTEEDVQREKNISDQKIVPSHTIQTFSQLRSLFE